MFRNAENIYYDCAKLQLPYNPIGAGLSIYCPLGEVGPTVQCWRQWRKSNDRGCDCAPNCKKWI